MSNTGNKAYSTEVEGVTKQYNLTVKELAEAGLYQEIHEIIKAVIEGWAESYCLGHWLTAKEVMLNLKYRILSVLPSIDWDHISSKYVALYIGDFTSLLLIDKEGSVWNQGAANSCVIASFKQGNVIGYESIIARDGYEVVAAEGRITLERDDGEHILIWEER